MLSELQIFDSGNSYTEGIDYTNNVLIFLLSFSKAKENDNNSVPLPTHIPPAPPGGAGRGSRSPAELRGWGREPAAASPTAFAKGSRGGCLRSWCLWKGRAGQRGRALALNGQRCVAHPRVSGKSPAGSGRRFPQAKKSRQEPVRYAAAGYKPARALPNSTASSLNAQQRPLVSAIPRCLDDTRVSCPRRSHSSCAGHTGTCVRGDDLPLNDLLRSRNAG